MSSQTWTLSDVDNCDREHPVCLSNQDMPSATGSWRVSRKILRGGLRDGVELVEIDNGRMRILIVPTRGMGVWKVEYGDRTLGWRSPVRGPVHPKFVPLYDPNGLGWLEGFDEFLVRCGLESNGAAEFDDNGQLLYPLHGRIANRPAHFVDVTVDDTAGIITLRGIVEETRFHFQKLRLEASVTTAFDSAAFTVSDRVENFGGTPAEMQMLYHLNIGEPLLCPGDEVIAPVRSIRNRDSSAEGSTEGWNRYEPGVAGQAEDCFYMQLAADQRGQTKVLLKNADGNEGTTLSYNTANLPCFSLWKNMVASEDGYVTGFEPATNFPNKRTEEKNSGRVVGLAPGESWAADLEFNLLSGEESVREAEDSIRGL